MKQYHEFSSSSTKFDFLPFNPKFQDSPDISGNCTDINCDSPDISQDCTDNLGKSTENLKNQSIQPHSNNK